MKVRETVSMPYQKKKNIYFQTNIRVIEMTPSRNRIVKCSIEMLFVFAVFLATLTFHFLMILMCDDFCWTPCGMSNGQCCRRPLTCQRLEFVTSVQQQFSLELLQNLKEIKNKQRKLCPILKINKNHFLQCLPVLVYYLNALSSSLYG